MEVTMPNGWTRIGTPEKYETLFGNPQALKKAIQRDVASNGAALDEVYFEQSGRPAYALIHFPGTPTDLDTMSERLKEGLGVSEMLTLLTVEELEEAANSGASAD
jgi:hypothetical protein